MNRFLPAIALVAIASPVSADVFGASLSSWQGGYIGAQGGFIASSEFSSSLDPSFTGTYEGDLGGIFFGYRRQFDTVVVGGEFDVMSGNNEVNFSNNAGASSTETGPTIYRAGGEVGYDLGRFLPYAGLGVVHWALDAEAGRNNATGHYFGIGMEFQTGPGTSIGLELNRHSLGNFELAPSFDLDFTTVDANFAIRF
ncbi:hypothetical protein HKCCE4037_03395 [Rhodobacterales bacterium HKCCE4037]|nr:hypothetical protein [Rhodobacterales bacterium HKCCE4037]